MNVGREKERRPVGLEAESRWDKGGRRHRAQIVTEPRGPSGFCLFQSNGKASESFYVGLGAVVMFVCLLLHFILTVSNS